MKIDTESVEGGGRASGDADASGGAEATGDAEATGGAAGRGDASGSWPVALAPVFDIARPTVGFIVSSTGYAVARRFRETLAPLELEPREFALLRAVGAAEGRSQQAIGERLGIPASRMVAFVDALERRSLLERRHNPADRRTRALHLTPAGRDLLKRAFVVAADLERHLCGQLSAAEREQLLELLRRVGQQLGVAWGPSSTHAHAALADG